MDERKGVLETYRCLISCCKKMPGMRLEDAFSENAVKALEREYKWLQEHLKEEE
jgi:hypothetical protein